MSLEREYHDMMVREKKRLEVVNRLRKEREEEELALARKYDELERQQTEGLTSDWVDFERRVRSKITGTKPQFVDFNNDGAVLTIDGKKAKTIPWGDL